MKPQPAPWTVAARSRAPLTDSQIAHRKRRDQRRARHLQNHTLNRMKNLREYVAARPAIPGTIGASIA